MVENDPHKYYNDSCAQCTTRKVSMSLRLEMKIQDLSLPSFIVTLLSANLVFPATANQMDTRCLKKVPEKMEMVVLIHERMLS